MTRIDANDFLRKLEEMTDHQMANSYYTVSSSFWLPASFVIRHFYFVICCSVVLMVLAQMCDSALGQEQSPNMIGTWNIEITFADGNKRALRLDARDGGKGTLLVIDPRLKVWGPGRPSEAKWTREDQNSVTFTGPVEFMLGNVGRDAGKLTFKGKFESADLITGEVEFDPLVGDRPSKHGTFKATRAR
jgi:hypothetical protein